jgi:hypothetical protein
MSGHKPRHPAASFTGLTVPFALQASVVLAYRKHLFQGIGRQGGQYAFAFIGVAIGAILVGSVLRLLQPRSPWKAFGTGLLVGGTVGVATTIAIIALLAITFANSNLTF